MKTMREEATGTRHADADHVDLAALARDGYMHLAYGLQPPDGSPAARDLEILYGKQEVAK